MRLGKNLIKTAAVLGGLGGAYFFFGSSNRPTTVLRIENEEQKLNSSALSYPLKNRDDHLKDAVSTRYDLLVIGGGCSGAGVALDGANRGLKCLLIEAYDFASGSSSKSTKLIHGGVRYLEQVFELKEKHRMEKIHLLTEALQDRSYMVHNAQYMNKLLPIIIPSNSTWETIYYYAGSLVYYLVYKAFDSNNAVSFPPPYILGKQEVLRAFPDLGGKISGGVVYYDGQMNDSRMNLDLLLTSTVDNYQPGFKPANILNYCSFKNFIKDEKGKIIGGVIHDKINNKDIEVSAKAVVNCTGVFADSIRQLDDPNAPRLMSASTGTHLIMSKKFASSKYGLLYPKTSDGRVVFLLPWQGKVIFGTTDTPTDDLTVDPKATFEDMMFLVQELQKIFPNVPSIELTKGIESKWCGLRPLVRETGAQDSKSISRKHVIEETPSGLISLMGGKWTTYRVMGEQTIDRVVKLLEREGKLDPKKLANNSTKNLPLVGEFVKAETVAYFDNREAYVAFYVSKLAQKYLIDRDILEHLIETYGDRAFDVAKYLKNHNQRERIHPDHPITKGEVRYQIQQEMAQSPIDVLLRRTRLSFLSGTGAVDSLVNVVDVFAEEFKWSKEARENQYKQCIEQLAKLNF